MTDKQALAQIKAVLQEFTSHIRVTPIAGRHVGNLPTPCRYYSAPEAISAIRDIMDKHSEPKRKRVA